MHIPKTCILCEHFQFSSGERAYSEYTPGTDWESCCALGHWKMFGREVYRDEYRTNLLTAETCEDFVFAKGIAEDLEQPPTTADTAPA